MSFIKNTGIFVEGDNLFFTEERARTAAVSDAIASGVTNVAPSQNAVFEALELKIDSSLLGASGGVAELDANGKLKNDQIPAIAITDVFVVADNDARDALEVETGDVAVVTSTGLSWIYDGSEWQELKSDGKVTSVNSQTGDVSLDSDDISEGSTNLYFLDSRAKDAAVVNSSTGTETDQAMSVSAAKAYSESQASAASGAALSAAEAYTDLAVSGLASESYVDNAVSGLASESYVDNAVSGLASESYVDNAVSGLASESYVDNAVSGLASESYVDNAVSGLASETYVDQAEARAKRELGPVTSVTGSMTLDDEILLLCDVSEGSLTLTLPAASGASNGRRYIVKDNGSAASGSFIRIQRSGSDELDGEEFYDIKIAYESVTVITDQNDWYIV
jgi:hypothetical protein